MFMSSSMVLLESLAANIGSTLTGDRDFVTPYVFRMFSGARPTMDQIRALSVTSGGAATYVMSGLPALLTALGAKSIITQINSGSSLPVSWSPDAIKMKFNDMVTTTTSLQDDPPTWGLIYLFPGAAHATIPENWTTRTLLYFTVGDQSSLADVKIKGGIIPKGSAWKPNNFEIAITGAVK